MSTGRQLADADADAGEVEHPGESRLAHTHVISKGAAVLGGDLLGGPDLAEPEVEGGLKGGGLVHIAIGCGHADRLMSAGVKNSCSELPLRTDVA